MADDLPLRQSSSPWRWIPSLYFAEGLPYVVVMTVAVIMYKRLGVSNAEIALYTSWLYLPWVIKPLWSPLVEATRTRRGWIVLTQLLVGAGLAGTALAIPGDRFLGWTLATLTFVAFSSATHDVAADGFYMLALDDHQQAWFVGIRNTCYRLAMIAGQGLLVMFAGALETATGLPLTTVEVRAVETVASTADEPFAPERFAAPLDEASAGADEPRIVVATPTTPLSWQDRPAATVQAAVEAARAWNAAHGFTPPTAAPSAPPAADALAGDVAIIALRLAAPLAEGSQLTAIFSREGGDASFRTLEGERFVITPANAAQPFFAVVQVDRQVAASTSATFAVRSGNLPLAWSATFYLLAGLFGVAALYHAAALPRPAADERHGPRGLWAGFAEPLSAFFAKPRIVTILAFLLLYRFAEAQLVKLAAPFLLDSREAGGLALSTGQVGFVYGTVGVVMLTVGGLLGGFAAARHGLKRWLWPMVLAINLPNAAYVYLALVRPESYLAVNAAVAIEQFGYGFGFTAYMVYCLYIAQGPHQTVHYALCTGFMALGMMLPGMWSGWLEEQLGYQRFFLWVMLATLPSFAVAALIPLDADFGRRRESPAVGEGEA